MQYQSQIVTFTILQTSFTTVYIVTITCTWCATFLYPIISDSYPTHFLQLEAVAYHAFSFNMCFSCPPYLSSHTMPEYVILLTTCAQDVMTALGHDQVRNKRYHSVVTSVLVTLAPKLIDIYDI